MTREAEHVSAILEAGMRALNLTGEITVRSDGAHHTRWIGKPDAIKDVTVDVQIIETRNLRK